MYVEASSEEVRQWYRWVPQNRFCHASNRCANVNAAFVEGAIIAMVGRRQVRLQLLVCGLVPSVRCAALNTRTWNCHRKHGFQDLMTYTLRPNAPKLLVMARPPRLLEPDPPASVQRRAAGQSWQREQQQQLQLQQELEPVGVPVRTRRSTLVAH